MITLLAVKLLDDVLERVRRSHHNAIVELQSMPFVRARIHKDVQLADGVPTPIPHGLGRAALVFVSPVRGASTSGRVDDNTLDGTHDRTKFALLEANGYGATVTVDVVVL